MRAARPDLHVRLAWSYTSYLIDCSPTTVYLKFTSLPLHASASSGLLVPILAFPKP